MFPEEEMAPSARSTVLAMWVIFIIGVVQYIQVLIP